MPLGTFDDDLTQTPVQDSRATCYERVLANPATPPVVRELYASMLQNLQSGVDVSLFGEVIHDPRASSETVHSTPTTPRPGG